MGVDYRAQTIIGVRIPHSSLHEMRTVQGCDCTSPGNGKYCSECGEKRVETKSMPIGEYTLYDGEPNEFLWGWDREGDRLIARTGKHIETSYGNGFDDECDRFVGFTIKTGSSRGDDHVEGPSSFPDVAKEKERLQGLLEPMGLWVEADFGLWTVLGC